MSGCAAQIDGRELPNYECIINVFDAVRKAGAHLTGIDIEVSKLRFRGALALDTPEIRQLFSYGMQQLEEFMFRRGDDVGTEALGQFYEFLSLCLNTASLQKLHLYMRRTEITSPRIELGRILGTRHRPKLTEVVLVCGSVHLPELVLFLQQLPEPMKILHSKLVYLSSGTW